MKVDRVACPWLIRRFVDKDAEFIFVEEDQLLMLAQSMKAIPYDAPRIPEIKLTIVGRDARLRPLSKITRLLIRPYNAWH